MIKTRGYSGLSSIYTLDSGNNDASYLGYVAFGGFLLYHYNRHAGSLNLS